MSLTPARPARGATRQEGKSERDPPRDWDCPPHHTNLEFGRSDALGPKLLLPRFRRQIGDIAGNRVEPGFERSRQAAEGNLRIERLRRWRAVDETDRNAGREEAAQSRRADKCNIHTCAHHQGQVAKELNRVAEPVVVEHKDARRSAVARATSESGFQAPWRVTCPQATGPHILRSHVRIAEGQEQATLAGNGFAAAQRLCDFKGRQRLFEAPEVA